MKIRNDHYKNTSDFEGRKGSATLNMDRLSLFMDNMISNYNFPELAVLREWVSNAHDAHVAAGITTPVKVTIPSQLNPTLVVQDFGLGMSPDFVENVYLDFGSSSKNDGNNEIGGFGIGGKSALAIAPQYTMTTISEGLKSVYIFERSPKGGVDFKNPIHNIPTDEPSGVTVQVAVDRIGEYSATNINRVLAGWSNDAIELSTGKKFFSIPDSSTQVSWDLDLTDHSRADEPDFETDIRTERGYVLHGALDTTGESKKLTTELGLGYGEHVVLVGPVAYIFQPDLSTTRVLREYMVASVNIGDVSFPSSREVIESTRNNRSFVGKCFEQIVVEADKLLQQRADGLTDRKSALSLHRSPLVQNRRDFKLTFRNELIPTTFTPKAGDSIFEYEHTGGWRGIKDYRLSEKQFSEETSLKLEIETLVVLDDDSALQGIRNNARLRHSSLEAKPADLSGYLVVSKKPSEWLKAAAKTTIKSSELAEVARDFRKKKRDEAAAAAAAGITLPSTAPVRKSRKDRIGEYRANWMVFGTNTEGELTTTLEESDLMDFFTNHFDPAKTLVLSTHESDYYPTNFVAHFNSFKLNPKDAQFLAVGTGSKIETLRILLGEEVKITDLETWMKENFSKEASFNGRKPREIAAEFPFSMDTSVSNLIEAVKLKRLHPKYDELLKANEELAQVQALLGQYHYDQASRFVRGLLEDFSTEGAIVERPEFFFLTQLSYYRSYRDMDKAKKDAIAHAMNQMMEHWLDNLALEEAAAEDAAREEAQGASQQQDQVATLAN